MMTMQTRLMMLILKTGWIKSRFPFFLLIAVFMASCSSTPKVNFASSKIGMPNPASIYCADQGGELRIMKNTEGEMGICFFEDGSHCEEWVYYRKECTKGENFTEK